MQEGPTIIVDYGSGICKAGFSAAEDAAAFVVALAIGIGVVICGCTGKAVPSIFNHSLLI
jgi:hypothetical protein